MVTSQVALEKERVELKDMARQHLPEVSEAMMGLIEKAYKPGALDKKTKRLMSIAIALGVGCKNCTLAQTQFAINEGATKEEILETLGVVISMRGTTGFAESLRVIQFLNELEVL